MLATVRAPGVVGYKPGGWLVYDPTDGAPEALEPELLVPALGRLPIPLSEVGAEVMRSELAAAFTMPSRHNPPVAAVGNVFV